MIFRSNIMSIGSVQGARFTKGIVGTNLKRFDMGTKACFIGRAPIRRVTG